MLNITQLENRQKKYKIKSYIPISISMGILFITFIILTNIFFSTEYTSTKEILTLKVKEKEHIIMSKNTKHKLKEIEKYINIPKHISEYTTQFKLPHYSNHNNTNKKILLYPSFEFIQNIQESTSVTIPKVIQVSDIIVNKINIPATEIEKNELKIIHKNTNKDIENVLKRFQNNNNPALSLFVAKKYYELGDYKKSYNYALITNDINSEIDDSWIIFAKSLVKLKQKNKAVKILTKYINQSHSSEAKVLLDDILTGKFNE